MDDIFGIILGLALGFILIVALLYLFVYVIIPGGIIYFLGRQFYSQINTYKLVAKTKAVLALTGLLSLITAAVFVQVNAIHPIVIAPASASLFLATSCIIMAFWAYSKKRPYIDELNKLHRRQVTQEHEQEEVAHKISYLKDRNKNFKEMHGIKLQEQEKLNGIMRELCVDDPRTYMIKKREWEDELKHASNKILSSQERQLIASLRQTHSNQERQNREGAIKLSLLKLEKIGRVIGKPQRQAIDNENKLRTLENRRSGILQNLQSIRTEIKAKQNGYDQFIRSGIVLN